MTTAPAPSQATFEHHAPGRLGIGDAEPRLSWQTPGADPAYVQQAYRVEVSISSGAAAGAVETTLHEVSSPGQILVPWPARPLASRERATVRVQVDGGGGFGPWSEASWVEAGLLEPSDWQGGFVGPAWDEDHDVDLRPALVRHEFSLPAQVVAARLYLSAHGVAEAEINGERIGDEALTPGWTSYTHRLRYATFDVTDQLREGGNAIGVWLGDGWYRGRIGFEGGRRNVYGQDLSALVQLEVVTADGARHTIASGESWQAGFGPILLSSLYDGEQFDARLWDADFSRPGFTAEGWSAVQLEAVGTDALVAPMGPPMRCTGELAPVSVVDKGDGRFLLDFGQNHTGRLRLRASGPAGTRIVLRHAEVLQEGELYTRTLRDAAATDVLVLAGGDIEWEPRFTIHGYRYAEVSGWPGGLEPGDVLSRVYHSDMARTGWFRSSDAAIERLHENAVWSLRSNFLDIPTDCPQRDERLGWTGDLQVFAPTAAFLYDVTGMLSSWLCDLALEQEDVGTVPLYVPYLPLGEWGGIASTPMAVWGDAAVLTPDVLHQRTGDVGLLRRQYRSAVDWVNGVEKATGESRIVDNSMQLGDWLDPAAPPENPFEALTAADLVATAYFAFSARRLAAVATILGEDDDAAHYGALADEVAAAFADRYLTAEGLATSDTQTAYALITAFDLYPDEASKAAGEARLAELVRKSDGHISTGFAGTPLVSDALTRAGNLDEAYLQLQQDSYPSWLYPVTMGATTIWERWDSMLPDGTVNPGDMTSFNHYALGAVADWLHRVVAGLAPAAPGYRRIHFAPRPGGTLSSAGATHLTPYGLASIDWELDGGTLRTTVVVPSGTTASVDLPGTAAFDVGPGTHSFESAAR
ncbi:glycoside hydrolase family 78 protein [Arthrobacter sp. 35W]|uniref:glycoside hydrolase family 78 protein n=1 Tax=Arthrobacter sp. 35W TaxID=1132441 RepID=UPI0004197CA1|nr:glycoside hydrolase family 78 protein [Arthrobacter sp. 35W]